MWGTKAVSEKEMGEKRRSQGEKDTYFDNEPLLKCSRTPRATWTLREATEWWKPLRGYLLMEYRHTYVGAVRRVRTDESIDLPGFTEPSLLP
jgi:hypothetical protein